jgi:hypothetical protein
VEKIDNVELWQSLRQYLRLLGKKDQKPFGLEKEIIVEKVLKKVISENFDALRYIIFSSFSGITHLPKWVMAYRDEKYEAIADLYNHDKFLKKNSLSKLYVDSDTKKILRIKVVDGNNFSLNQNQIITLSIPNNLIDRHNLSVPKNENKKNFEYYNYDDKLKGITTLSKPEKHEKWKLKGENLNKVANELLDIFGNNSSAEPLKLSRCEKILHSLHAALYFKEIKNIFYIPTMEKGGLPSINIILFSEQIKDDAEIAKKLESIQLILSYLSVIVKRTELEQLVIKASTQSAIAAIMSRNGSHNIGSHVLAAVGNNYNDLPDDQILFKYIQHRMDYIAQIATEFPDWTYPTWFARDLMRRFYMQRHLLKYISQADGLGAYESQPKKGEVQKNKILIKIRNKNDEPTKYIISPEFDKPDFKEDVQIAIPGGIIGHQAFCTIIENIIRNAAKHEWTLLPEDNRSKNLKITIEIDDKKDRDFIIFRIWDNVSKLNDSKLIDDINERLTKSFVHQETGHLLKSNWGLAEMKISAGFLNRSGINQIGSDNKDDILFKLDNDKNEYSGIIKAIRHEKQKSLGYEFAIPRPKEVLIIGMDKNGLDESLLQQNNIYLEDELTPNTDLDYEFVVLYDDGKNDFITKLKNYENKSTEVRSEIERFPFRLFIVSNNSSELILEPEFLSKRIVLLSESDIKLGNDEELPAFKLLLYKKWVRHLMKRRGIITDNTGEKSKNIELKMLINLSGEPGHTKEDIVKLIFYRFKDKLLDQISSKEYSDAKNQLTKVANADIDEYAKNNKKSYTNVNKLIDAWKQIVVNRDPTAEIPANLKQSLKSQAEIYFEILKNMYVRYDEDCQTLPKNYRGQSSIATGNLEGLCIDDGISISITDNEDDKNPPFDIAYNRHAQVEASYYTEALSGSQLYFLLLQNLADENDYERDKRILQLIENALLRVVIIDERVAQYYSNCNDAIKVRFDKGNFEIPLKIKVGDTPDGKYELVKNTDSSADYLPIDEIPSDTYDIFIIHQGILDKIGPTDPSELKELIDTIKESVPFVIITSGRGQPEKIPNNAKFLPFSNIESFVLSDFPEKYLLTQMAMKIITEGV